MGTARSVFFTVASVIMIISGVAGLVVLIIMMNERLCARSSSVAVLLICCILIIIYNIFNIISGLKGLQYSNRRSNSSVIIRLPQITVIMCLIAVIFSFINGVKAWHMAVLILTGILVPAVYIFAAVRKSYPE